MDPNIVLKTIVVEDEPLSRAFLNNLLQEYPQINVIATAASETEAIDAIQAHHPDLILLDIELQNGSGFGILQKTSTGNFKVIFTTALDHHSINIIRVSGMDYIQKPIDTEGLQKAIEKIKQDSGNNTLAQKYLLETLENNNVPLHILVNTGNSAEYVLLKDIVALKTDEEGKTDLLLHSGNNVVSTTSLKEFDMLLSGYNFFRAHQQYLVNTLAIKQIVDDTESYMLMNNGNKIPVSEKRKAALSEIISTGNATL